MINEDIDPSIIDDSEPLTTIIAIRHAGGVVIASDSQATEGKMKTLGVTKIFVVNGFMAVGGSGDADNVRLFVERAKAEFTEVSRSEGEFREKIQMFLWRLHKKYNLGARDYLGKDEKPFRPNLIVGARNGDGSIGLYFLREDGMVYHVDDMKIIGTGGDLARLVIKQFNRGYSIIGQSVPQLSSERVVESVCYAINEIKESDSKSGGTTKVVVIDSSHVRELPDDEVERNYTTFINGMAKALQLLFQRSGVSLDGLDRLFPKGSNP